MLTVTTTKSQRVLLWLVPSLVTGTLVVFVPATASARQAWVGWIPGVLGVGVAWFAYVSIPRRIAVNGAQLVIQRPIGSISVPIVDIRSVNASPWNRGLVTITAKKRKIFLLRSTRNLFAIVAEIKHQNPSVVVIGEVPHAA